MVKPQPIWVAPEVYPGTMLATDPQPAPATGPTEFPACSYLLGLTTTRALTDGDADAHATGPWLTFCIDRP